MVQINAAATLPAFSPVESQGVYVMSTGALVAFLTVSGASKYAVSTDSGATWTAALDTPAGPSGPQTWPGLALGGSMVQKGDVLTAFWVNSALTQICLNSFTFNTSTKRLANTVSSPGLSTGFGLILNGGSATLNRSLISAVDDGDRFHLAYLQGGLLSLTTVTSTSANAGNPHPYVPFSIFWYIPRSFSSVADLHLSVVPGSSPPALLLSVTDVGTHTLTVIPAVYTGAGFAGYNSNSIGGALGSTTAEAAYFFSGSDLGHAPLFDSSGKLDLLIRDGSTLYAVKRTATGSYTAPIPLYSSINQSGSRGVAAAYDSITGNAYVAFESTINQSNGEIYLLKRAAGVWGAPTLFAGGNAAGYSAVLCAKAIAGAGAPAIFQHGAGVDYGNISGSGPPFTPTVSTPSGNITTLTPVMAAPYVNPAPSDVIGFQQWQVQRVSDSVSFLDTGKVATSTPALLYAGTTLVYGTPYQARVRYWDSISSGGAGTPSGWSAWSTFTPVHGPVGTITSIVAGGATISSSPGTLVAPDMVVHFTYTQASGNAANSYRLKIYAADTITLIQASSPVAGTIASGGTVTTFDTLFNLLQNHTIYFIAVETTDAVTGLSADGPQWQLTTAWTPPSTPGSFVVTHNDDLGTVTGSFTNDGTAVTNNLYFRPSGTTAWTLTSISGQLFTSFTALPPPQTPYDYRVSAVGSTGIESLFAEADSVILGGRGTDEWSVIINDLENPGFAAWMGAPDSWDDLKWTPMKDRDAYLPLMGRFQKSSWGVEEWESAQLKFYIIGQYWLKNGTQSPYRQDALRLRQMYSNAKWLQYRDPKGRIKIVEMTLNSGAPADDFNDHCEFTLEEMDVATMQFYVGAIANLDGTGFGIGGDIGGPIGG